MAMFRCLSPQLAVIKFSFDVKPACNYILFNRNISYVSKQYDQDNPTPLFLNKEVQSLLKSLSRIDINKVHRQRKLGDRKLEKPIVKFLTEDQLQNLLQDAKKKCDSLVQMPPVVKVRKPIDKVLCKDPALQGLDSSTLVFSDITFGIKNSNRVIVTRDPEGTLREADWPLRDRMNQLYFPAVGRKLKAPLMFQEPYLTNLLSRNEYEFILDRACIQYEPDDTEYQRVTSSTYQYLNDNNGFDLLRSTRHFGSLTFFLAWFKMIDNLLLELIETCFINEVNILLQLYGKLHNLKFETEEFENLEKYIKEFATKRAPLELALQAYKDIEKERKELRDSIRKAHGQL